MRQRRWEMKTEAVLEPPESNRHSLICIGREKRIRQDDGKKHILGNMSKKKIKFCGILA